MKSIANLRSIVALAGALLTSLCLSLPANAETLKWRNVSHINETHAFVLAETGGHTVGTGRGTGLGFFPNEQISNVAFGFTIDYLKGEGSFLAYETYSFPDGASLTLRRNGKTKLVGNGAEFTGNFDIIGGSGRFAGATGSGSFYGKRLAALSSGADQYFDYVADIHLK